MVKLGLILVVLVAGVFAVSAAATLLWSLCAMLAALILAPFQHGTARRQQRIARRRRRAEDAHPLAQLERRRRAGRIDRQAQCDELLADVRARRWTREDTPQKAHGYLVLAWDQWTGNEFADRPVRSSGWFSSQDGPADDSLPARLAHDYVLADEDKTALRRLQNHSLGQFPWVAAQIVHRIAGRPVWEHDFFDEHAVRLDLVDELTAIGARARALNAQQAQLGPAPSGDLREDPDVVDLYVRKADLIDEAVDQLLERVSALASFAEMVDRVQAMHRDQRYRARLESSDDLEQMVETEVDRHESARVQQAAADSAAATALFT